MQKLKITPFEKKTFTHLFFPPHNSRALSSRASRGNYLWLIAAAWILKNLPEGCVRGQVCGADLSGRWLMPCVLLICTTSRERHTRFPRLWRNTPSPLLWNRREIQMGETLQAIRPGAPTIYTSAADAASIKRPRRCPGARKPRQKWMKRSLPTDMNH